MERTREPVFVRYPSAEKWRAIARRVEAALKEMRDGRPDSVRWWVRSDRAYHVLPTNRSPYGRTVITVYPVRVIGRSRDDGMLLCTFLTRVAGMEPGFQLSLYDSELVDRPPRNTSSVTYKLAPGAARFVRR